MHKLIYWAVATADYIFKNHCNKRQKMQKSINYKPSQMD